MEFLLTAEDTEGRFSVMAEIFRQTDVNFPDR